MQKDYTKIDEEFDKEFPEMFDRFGNGTFQPEVKNFIHTQISLSEQSLLERVEKMIIKNPKCDCRTYTLGEHNCDFTSNDAIKDVINLLTSLKHPPQEEVKNK